MTLARRRITQIFILAICFASAAPSFARTKKHPPSTPIDLNTATLSQLEELPGVGPVTAKAILEFREKSGPFRRVDDLLAVHRISEKKLAKIRPYVAVRPEQHASKEPSAHSRR